MAKQNFSELAENVLQAVGGKENVVAVSHCITRLRFTLKDESIPKDEEIEKIEGVLGIMKSAGQYQVVVGQTVNRVYEELCKIGGFSRQDEILSTKVKKETTFKSVCMDILDYMSGSLNPLIPVLIVAAMFKTVIALFGPDMLAVMNPDGDVYKLFNFVGDAGFYFLPIMIGFTASKKLNCNTVLSMFLCGVLLHPTFTQMAADGTAFSVFGIPCSVQGYAATIIPAFLSVWALSYVEKFFYRVVPPMLRVVVAPFLTIIVMLPITLCVFGPAGAFIGQYICNALLAMGEFGGIATILGIALIGALWEFLVMSGMHWILLSTLLVVIAQAGQESVVAAGIQAASFSVGGMCLGAFFLQKKASERSESISYVIAQVIGGVTEPGLYGVGFGYKRPFLGMAIGGFAGALYSAIVGLTAFNLVPVASFLIILSYTGGSTMNLINGALSCVIAFVVAAIATYMIGLEKKTK